MNVKRTLTLAVALAATVAPALALAQNYDGRSDDGDRGRSDRGTIVAVDGTNIRLEDGRTIFLHHGTVINPRGITLQPGQRIFVTGYRGGRGAINANEIDVEGGMRHHHHDDDDGR